MDQQLSYKSLLRDLASFDLLILGPIHRRWRGVVGSNIFKDQSCKFAYIISTQIWGGTSDNLPANPGGIRDLGLIPGLGRAPGGGHGNPLQYPCRENPHGQRSLAGYIHGVAKSQTWMKRLSRHMYLQVAYIISTQFQANIFTLTARETEKWDLPMSPERRNGSAEDTSGLHCRMFLI